MATRTLRSTPTLLRLLSSAATKKSQHTDLAMKCMCITQSTKILRSLRKKMQVGYLTEKKLSKDCLCSYLENDTKKRKWVHNFY